VSLILDASAALAWFFVDEYTTASRDLLDHVTTEGAVVTGLWRVEVGNTLLLAERRSRMHARDREEAMRQLDQLPIVIDEETGGRAWSASFQLAQRFRLTLYDACYLELAQRRALPLATLDRDLREAATALGIATAGA
jgi:predicted nucleic acid-binding protein